MVDEAWGETGILLLLIASFLLPVELLRALLGLGLDHRGGSGRRREESETRDELI